VVGLVGTAIDRHRRTAAFERWRLMLPGSGTWVDRHTLPVGKASDRHRRTTAAFDLAGTAIDHRRRTSASDLVETAKRLAEMDTVVAGHSYLAGTASGHQTAAAASGRWQLTRPDSVGTWVDRHSLAGEASDHHRKTAASGLAEMAKHLAEMDTVVGLVGTAFGHHRRTAAFEH